MKHICTYALSYILNAGMEMDSLLDPVIDSSHRSYFAAVEHRALEVLRPRPPGEVKASMPLIRVLVINDNGLWINDFI